MGGVLIAFEDYNVIKGVFGSPWVGLGIFPAVSFFAGLHELSAEYAEAERVRAALGLPGSDPSGAPSEPDPKDRHRKKIQLLIYAPNFISVIVLCGMVRMFLSPVGPLNSLLGISTNWMTMPEAFRTILHRQRNLADGGLVLIMYTAALANASKDLEEAAIVDGANILQQIWYGSFPPLRTSS